MVIWCYLATFLTDPGRVPPGWTPFGEEEVRPACMFACLFLCLHMCLCACVWAQEEACVHNHMCVCAYVFVRLHARMRTHVCCVRMYVSVCPTGCVGGRVGGWGVEYCVRKPGHTP